VHRALELDRNGICSRCRRQERAGGSDRRHDESARH
jgi:hypothetical protein